MATDCCTHRQSERQVPQLPKDFLQVRCEPEVGHQVLTNRIKPLLERYQQSGKQSARDQQICDELLRALEISDKINVAAATPHHHASLHPLSTATSGPRNPITQESPGVSATPRAYLTSYKDAYKAVEGQQLVDVTRPLSPKRPLSSYPYGSTYNIADPIGVSTYDREFNRNAIDSSRDRERDRDRVRYGPRGENRNNPHPLESFMVWRFGRRTASTPQSSGNHGNAVGRYFPANEDADRLHEPLRLSTYRYDYQKTAEAAHAVRVSTSAGKPMTFELNGSAVRAPSAAPYFMHTTQRSSYQPATKVNEILRPSTTRYGSNKLKSVANAGITPAVSDVRLALKTRTHYDQEVNDRAIDVYEELSTRTTIPHGKCVKRPPSTIVPGIVPDDA